MKAAVVQAARTNPVYADFPDPIAQGEHEIIAVHASALTHLAKARASGAHYSAGGKFPGVAGTDGVGRTADGRRLYFAQPLAPNGAMSERTLIHPKYTVSVPDEIDDVTAAAIANPGMSAWAALLERAHLVKGETVLVNGATGTAGRIAVQLARHLGAARVIATGRNLAELEEVKSLGADLTVPLGPELEAAMIEQCARGIDVVVDYLWGDSARTLITAIAKGSASCM
jgi:NADPH:quinone reductase-like Zn-dependent oxidoreductase